MILRLIAVISAFLGFAGALSAERLVVVELFTSQGCHSCPPADEILADMNATHDDILALSLHVDYWDYLGWKDDFAHAAFTPRQADYNMNLKSRYTLVTPQMVFDGRSHVAGARTTEIFSAFSKARKANDTAGLSLGSKLTASGSVQLEAVVSPLPGSLAADVYLVRYGTQENVAIARGENKGKTLTYTNVVSEWIKIGEWNGTSETRFVADVAGDDQAAVIVQVANSGPVLAARKLAFAGN